MKRLLPLVATVALLFAGFLAILRIPAKGAPAMQMQTCTQGGFGNTRPAKAVFPRRALAFTACPLPGDMRVLFAGKAETQCAPHGNGNVYAPEILFENGVYRMWFGGQGRDGHDRIHLAESRDGLAWTQKGVVLDCGEDNHVNDPSVVHVGGLYYLYYTRARVDIADVIGVAVSTDGVHWNKRATVLAPGKPDQWDGFLVGRPCVLYEAGLFKMWYDGRRDLPPNAPDTKAPKAANSQRCVGYATSRDGLHWRRVGEKPVYADDAGGVDVRRVGRRYVMLYESEGGVKRADSPDGLHWRSRGLWIAKSGTDADRGGCLTPFLWLGSGEQAGCVYFGAASAATWDANSIACVPLTQAQRDQLFDDEEKAD